MSTQNNYTPETLLAKDISTMAILFADNTEILEYLSDMSFNCSQIFSESPQTIDWYKVYSLIDKMCNHRSIEARNELATIVKKLKTA